ncbi:MAG: HlyD family efflux transporter periplasmic adaptor subunit [Chitinophaga sp.]|uniref:HlyD family secretion protein n=1 Tax=Chitinophaga sp. TaxID=1869181 RepID=UPI001B15723C|nr:HlyD family efflux transporter periplasmic adaptor subunit [Chitinophaga sp.]MBO9728594.1 HlyD family efflux transporter periplasmic adaptor subunit [Chitinophaga sp.]
MDQEASVIINDRPPVSQEILSGNSGFLSKWALLVILAITLAIILMTWFIGYPETVTMEAGLSNTLLPVEIKSGVNSKIIKVFVDNDSIINPGSDIIWLEGDTDHETVLQLLSDLEKLDSLLKKNSYSQLDKEFKVRNVHLGSLQPQFETFKTSFRKFLDFYSNNYFNKRKKLLSDRLDALLDAKNAIDKQIHLATKDVSLSADELDANSTLYKERVISASEFRNIESAFLRKEQTVPQLEAALNNNRNQQAGLAAEILEIEHQESQEQDAFTDALYSMRSSLLLWIRSYTIKAPSRGRLSFPFQLKDNQPVKNDALIAFVYPIEDSSFIEGNLPHENIGKLAIGQTAIVKLNAYPTQEYGELHGKVSYISEVPSDSGYRVKVALENGLLTSHNYHIPYKVGLKGSVTIITRKEKLFDKIFYPVYRTQ